MGVREPELPADQIEALVLLTVPSAAQAGGDRAFDGLCCVAGT